MCLLVMSEAIPIVSHKRDSLNMGRIRMTLTDKPKWRGRVQETATL